MICYKDKTYCSYSEKCDNVCELRLTKKDLAIARSKDLAISYMLPVCDILEKKQQKEGEDK